MASLVSTLYLFFSFLVLLLGLGLLYANWEEFMTKKFIYLLSAITAMEVVTIFAQEGTTKVAEGTLMLRNKTYQLAHAVAYESTIDEEDGVVAVLSGHPVASEMLKEARAAEKDGGGRRFQKAIPQAGLQENRRIEVLERGRRWYADWSSWRQRGNGGTQAGGRTRHRQSQPTG